ncbi:MULTISPECIES: hypothetical protein [Desulfosporosinus]|uniref:Uncharacterized protein n=2 Tax=Desulfosporosinus TaxID=79206 RepID=A0A1G7S6Q6_9FIRM|nr:MULTISPECIES: hypothetical protein [Desulfosporosinus]AFQ45784.1 hypothetical protein Desmer_3949 [Desulfosporosinus meridiei DSM 13257]SDG17850.1 hypothetical protein SAMN05443529_101283 [Desulfosporosinus hippei DSM 8344]
MMNRTEILRLQREKVLANILQDNANRAKWLTELMDIDDQIEEMNEQKSKVN